MRLIGSFGLVLIMIVCFDSCFEGPHFSDVPVIEFSSVVFKKGPPQSIDNPSPADTLILTLNFKDGDGDLGLGPDDIFSPFNDKYYYVFPNGEKVSYKTKRTVPGYDTLPEYIFPYDCTNWQVDKDSAGHAVDTIYFQLNPYHYNIFVDFYVRNEMTLQFERYDWLTEFGFPTCILSGFNSRFPVLSKDPSHSTPQEGKIRYAMKSVAFTRYLSIKVLQLHIWIYDRARNKSNVVMSEKFQLGL